MGYVILTIIVVLVGWQLLKGFVKGSALLGGSTEYGLLARGVPARGILIKVGSQRNARGTSSPGYYELRAVTIDVEIPGQSPYVVDCLITVPANLCRLILPGATLELRVDPATRQNIAVYGPGVGLSSAGYQ